MVDFLYATILPWLLKKIASFAGCVSWQGFSVSYADGGVITGLRWMKLRQLKLLAASHGEKKREVACRVCRGNRLVCIKSSCPILLRTLACVDVSKQLDRTSFFGATPPAVFVGQWGYPKVLTGPLVPALPVSDAAIMDTPESWLEKSFEELIRYRFSLVRGKTPIHVKSARLPSGALLAIQESVLSAKPADMEVWLKKKPLLRMLLSPREAPVGPSAPLERVKLTDNPSVPRALERAVGDEDLRANTAVFELYRSKISQRQLVRALSAGLLGVKAERRLVPTEWSITAVDDILGRALHQKVLDYAEINEYWVAGHEALANSVQILFLPTPWMYEALEGWTFLPHESPASDFELAKGRKDYPRNVVGAYHAVRLPILEFLHGTNRQAGAVAFLEVRNEWIPLGVWRFREIAREALRKPILRFNRLHEALEEIARRLTTPMDQWLNSSRLVPYHVSQQNLQQYFT
ncbi:MAG: hypothetical protein ACE5PO_04175 [Candidatus Bathyarchaeia archaeon]